MGDGSQVNVDTKSMCDIHSAGLYKYNQERDGGGTDEK